MVGQRLEDEVLNFGELTGLLEKVCGSPTRIKSRDFYFDLYRIPASPEEGRRPSVYFAVRENMSTKRRGTVGTARLVKVYSQEEAIDSLGDATYNLEDSARGVDTAVLGAILTGTGGAGAVYTLASVTLGGLVFGVAALLAALMIGSHHYTRFLDTRMTRQAVAGILEYV